MYSLPWSTLLYFPLLQNQVDPPKFKQTEVDVFLFPKPTRPTEIQAKWSRRFPLPENQLNPPKFKQTEVDTFGTLSLTDGIIEPFTLSHKMFLVFEEARSCLLVKVIIPHHVIISNQWCCISKIQRPYIYSMIQVKLALHGKDVELSLFRKRHVGTKRNTFFRLLGKLSKTQTKP